MSEQVEKIKPELIEMVPYGIFNRVGNVARTGVCARRDLEHQPLKDGETIKEGQFLAERPKVTLGYRMKRRQAYPSVGDQLGAIHALAKALHEQGIKLPDDVTEWIDKIESVKAEHPKREQA